MWLQNLWCLEVTFRILKRSKEKRRKEEGQENYKTVLRDIQRDVNEWKYMYNFHGEEYCNNTNSNQVYPCIRSNYK